MKVSLGQAFAMKNKNKKKKESQTGETGERSTGWFRSTWDVKDLYSTESLQSKAKQSDHISHCCRNWAQHPFRSQTPRKTDMQTELSPEDTTSHCAELSSQEQGSPTSSLVEQPVENPARRKIRKTSTSYFVDWKKQYSEGWATALRALQSCKVVSYVLVGVPQYLGVKGKSPAVPCFSRCSTKKMPIILVLTGSTNICLLPWNTLQCDCNFRNYCVSIKFANRCWT